MTNDSSVKWMPFVGGVLSIVSGAIDLVASLFITLRFFAINVSLYTLYNHYAINTPTTTLIIHGFFCTAMLVISIIPIVGGIFALRRKSWGWALAGAICATLSISIIGIILGIIAIVFIAMSKKEFTGKTSATYCQNEPAIPLQP